MENNCVSLETAKKLDAAGFPTDPALAWFEVEGDEFPAYVAPYTGEEDQQRAWTAQEIADQLPDHETVRLYAGHTRSDFPRMYRALAGNETAEADTMAEALANLWLKLNTKEADK